VLAAGIVHEDAAHGLGRGGKEVAAAVPVLRLIHVHQPHVSLVDQGRGLKRLAGRLLGEPVRGQPAQLVVDQRQQLFGRVRLAVRNGVQDAGDLAHKREYTLTGHGRQGYDPSVTTLDPRRPG
jgi:hypothetical protein